MFRFLQIVRVLVVMILAIRACAWIAGSVCAIATPKDVYWFESKMVYLAREAQHGNTLYPDWSQFPYEKNPYAPLYFVFVGKLAQVISLEEFGLRTTARVVSQFSVLLIAAVAGVVVRRETRSLGSAAIAALSVVAAAPMIGFGHMARPDLPAVAIGCAGLFAHFYGKTWRSQLVAVALLTIATLTKQTVAVPILILLGWQVARRESRKAVTVLAGWLCGVALLMLACTHFWSRSLTDMFAPGSDPFGSAFGLFTLQRVLIHMPDVVLVLVLAPFRLTRPVQRDSLLPFALMVVCWNVVACFKWGSDLNYFLDVAVIGSICTGMLWSRTSPEIFRAAAPPGVVDPRQSGRQSLPGRLVAHPILLSIFGITFLVLAGNVPLRWQLWYLELRIQDASLLKSHGLRRSSEEMIVEIMRSPSYRVLTDSPYLALQSFHQPPFVDTYLFRRLVMDDRIRPVELLRRIRAREYDFVFSVDQIARPGYERAEFCFPPVVAAAIVENYTLMGRTGNVFVYGPADGLSRSLVPP
jgi:hypothetical protein